MSVLARFGTSPLGLMVAANDSRMVGSGGVLDVTDNGRLLHRLQCAAE